MILVLILQNTKRRLQRLFPYPRKGNEHEDMDLISHSDRVPKRLSHLFCKGKIELF